MNDTIAENAIQRQYEGIVNMVKRWFATAVTSEAIRDWAEKFMQLNTLRNLQRHTLEKRKPLV